ncbi:MAG: hypothetical protein WCH11_07605 [Bdellovibrio sp.]
MKSSVNAQILPVALSPMEAGVALGQAPSNRLQMSPHHLLQSMLTSFGVQIERAVFCEIKGPHQFLNLSFSNHPHLQIQKFRVDEVMSACLFLQVPILAPQKFIEKSRVLTAELEDLHQGLMRRPESLRTSHFYLM